jgi:CheY-like chemotaxis protein/anti-sigma regulatory factor (Ser/Thr protein kinase)
MIKARVLVIEDESALRRMLAEGLTRMGHEVLLARDGSDGLEVFEKQRPNIVLTDVRMPGKRGIEVLRHIKTIDPEAKVVIMTGYGNEEIATEALRGGAINYLKKPFSFQDLHEVIEKIANIQNLEINKKFVLEETKRIVMANEIDRVWGVVNQLLICAGNVCGKEKIQELGLALYEIIVNAIEHGNLEITFDEKCEAMKHNGYEALLRERIADPVCSARRVVIDYRMIPGELHYCVADEGNGFDWQNLAYSDPSRNPLVPCGRGLFLARIYLDRVEFNRKGNKVHLVKYGKGGEENHERTGKK